MALMINFLSDFVILAVVTATSAGGRVVQDEQDGLTADERRVLSTYREALAVLESHFADVSGSFRHVGRFGIASDHERRVTDEGEFARSGVMAKLVSRSTLSRRGSTGVIAPNAAAPGGDVGAAEKAFSESTFAYDGEYALKLKRSSPGRDYSVAYFDKNVGPLRRSFARAFSFTCDASTTAGNVSIANLISRPRFSVKQVGSASDERRRAW